LKRESESERARERMSYLRRKKGFVRDLAHTQKIKCQKKPIFTDLKNRFEHIELPAKLLDYFLRSNKATSIKCRKLKAQATRPLARSSILSLT